MRYVREPDQVTVCQVWYKLDVSLTKGNQTENSKTYIWYVTVPRLVFVIFHDVQCIINGLYYE